MTFRFEASPLDTGRFGHAIARAEIAGPDDVPDLLAAAGSDGIEMVIVRTPAWNLAAAHELERAGALLCDTLVYYARALGAEQRTTAPNVRDALPSDVPRVGEIAAAAFAGYGGHYHSDPRLDRAAADATYVDWARRSVTSSRAWVVESDDHVVGFLALEFRDDAAEIVLNAIDPPYQRRGLYPQLIGAALVGAGARNVARCLVSTQLPNIAAQKAWIRAGFEPDHAVHTFHLWL